jgi:hypothetical protein
VSGDLMLMFLVSAGPTWDTYPSGWTAILDNFVWGSTQGRMSVLKRVSDGSEAGSVTATTASSTTSVHAVWVISGDGLDFTVSTPDIGSATKVADTATIDLPAVTVSHGEAEYLVFPMVGKNGGEKTATPPSGYTNLLAEGAGDDSSDPGLWVGQRRVAVTSAEDPGSVSFTPGWTSMRLGAVTVAVLAESSADLATGDHTHVEADVTDLDHWDEADHDALDHTGLTGVGGVGSQPLAFFKTGTLEVTTGASKFPALFDMTLVGVRAAVGTAPTGADLIVDVNLNGTTVYTTQANRPTISDGSTSSTETVPDVTAVAAGDLLSVDIDQIGSSAAGADLVVAIEFQEA